MTIFHLLIHAILHLVDLIVNAKLKMVTQFAHVAEVISVVHPHVILNVLSAPIVLLTKHARIKNASILVLELVASMPIAKLSIIVPSVVVQQIMLEIHS